MECLDTEIFCMHLDNELDAQTHAEVTEHLRTCQRCMDRLSAFAGNDARLRSVSPGLLTPQTPGQACYRAEDLSAYASGLIPAEEEARFEQHLHTCDGCLHEVMAMRGTLRLLRRAPLLAPPARLAAAVRRGFAGATPPSAVEKLGTLIVQMAADGLKFIEALLLPEQVRLAIGGQLVPVGAWRSAPGSEGAVALLDIQQSVRDLDLQMRVLQETPETVVLTIQVKKQGKPLARKRVSLSVGGRLLYSSNTSAQGAVEFSRLAPGEYTVRIPPEHVEVQLVLRAAAGATPAR